MDRMSLCNRFGHRHQQDFSNSLDGRACHMCLTLSDTEICQFFPVRQCSYEQLDIDSFSTRPSRC